MVDRGNHRIGDAERQKAVDPLRSHTGAGRLTLDEFADLAGAVYAAQTYGELDAVVQSLPPGLLPEPSPHPTPVSGAAGPTPGGAPVPGGPAPATGPAPARRRRRFVAVMTGSGARGRPGRDEPLPGAPLVRVHARGLWGDVTAAVRPTRAQRAVAAAFEGTESVSEPLARAQGALDDLATMPPRDRCDGAPVEHSRDRRDRRDRRPRRPAGQDSGPGPGGRDSERPGAPLSGTLTIMITDIAASTTLVERLGDRRWIEVLGEHDALVRAQVARHGGTQVKGQGDGFLVAFPSARRAILAAAEVQRALADHRAAHPDTGVSVRIGLHTGEIVDLDGDVFGQNVIVASRIAALAETWSGAAR